jgi:hypothetical protein
VTDEGLRLNARAKSEGHCVYCRDPLGDMSTCVRCDACGIAMHRACRQELTECPTLGCEGDGVEQSADDWRRWNQDMQRRRRRLGVAPREPGWFDGLGMREVVTLALVALLVVGSLLINLLTTGSQQSSPPAAAPSRAEATTGPPDAAARRQVSATQTLFADTARLGASEHGALGSVRAFLDALVREDPLAAGRFLPPGEAAPAQLDGLTRALAEQPRWEAQDDGEPCVRVQVYRNPPLGQEGVFLVELTVVPLEAGGWEIHALSPLQGPLTPDTIPADW